MRYILSLKCIYSKLPSIWIKCVYVNIKILHIIQNKYNELFIFRCTHTFEYSLIYMQVKKGLVRIGQQTATLKTSTFGEYPNSKLVAFEVLSFKVKTLVYLNWLTFNVIIALNLVTLCWSRCGNIWSLRIISLLHNVVAVWTICLIRKWLTCKWLTDMLPIDLIPRVNLARLVPF